jgi:hypothetical protein
MRPDNRQELLEDRLGHFILHVFQNRDTLGVMNVGKYPANEDAHFRGLDRFQNLLMNLMKFFVGVQRPECFVVLAFFDIHVLEIFGNEKREIPIEPEELRFSIRL